MVYVSAWAAVHQQPCLQKGASLLVCKCATITVPQKVHWVPNGKPLCLLTMQGKKRSDDHLQDSGIWSWREWSCSCWAPKPYREFVIECAEGDLHVILPESIFYPNPVRMCPLASNLLVNELKLILLGSVQSTEGGKDSNCVKTIEWLAPHVELPSPCHLHHH